MFDRLVKERGIHTLFWVYSAGLHCGQGKDVASVDYRQRFYPGAAYVDIAGIDIHANEWFGWGRPPWWGPSKLHPEDWIRTTYTHAWVVTRDELPRWQSPSPQIDIRRGTGVELISSGSGESREVPPLSQSRPPLERQNGPENIILRAIFGLFSVATHSATVR